MRLDQDDIVIRRWSALDRRGELEAALDNIFFEASNTKSFESDDIRRQFRRRWLGRYLEAQAHLAHVLFTGGVVSAETLGGYVIGAHDDPALDPRYEDIGYFHLLADVTKAFPAHLHINLRHDLRGLGLGRLLIDRFVEDVADAGLGGVHIVTGAGLRNVAFYRRNGFSFTKPFVWKGKDLVFLGRPVNPPASGAGR